MPIDWSKYGVNTDSPSSKPAVKTSVDFSKYLPTPEPSYDFKSLVAEGKLPSFNVGNSELSQQAQQFANQPQDTTETAAEPQPEPPQRFQTDLPGGILNPVNDINRFRNTKVGNFLDEAAQSAGRMFGLSPDQMSPATSTGNQVADTTANVLGSIAGYATNPTQLEMGIGQTFFENPLIQRAGSKAENLVNNALSKVAGSNAPNTLGGKILGKTVQGATVGGLGSAAYAPLQTLLSGGQMSDIPQQVVEQGLGGAALGGAFRGVGAAAGEGLKALADKYAGTKLGDALGNFFNRPKADPELNQATQDLLALPAPRPKALREGTIPGGEPIPMSGKLAEPLALPEGNYITPTRLTQATPLQTLNKAMQRIKPEVEQIVTPPTRRDLLINYIQQHTQVPREEIHNMPITDLRELGQHVEQDLRSNLYDVASQVAQKHGYDLPNLLEGRMPTLRDKIAQDAQRRVYGVYPESLPKVQRPKFNREVLGEAAGPKLGFIRPKVEPESIKEPEILASTPKPPEKVAEPVPTSPPAEQELQQYLESLFRKNPKAKKFLDLNLSDAEFQKFLDLRAKAMNEEPQSMRVNNPQGVQMMRAHPIPLRPENPNANIVPLKGLSKAVNRVKQATGLGKPVTEPITRKQMFDNVRKRFNIPVRYGRLGISDKNVLGIYKTGPEVIRTRQNGIQELSHELGHHLDKKLELQDPRYESELFNLLKKTGIVDTEGYHPSQLHGEGVAEYFRLLLTDPAKAKQLAPNFSKFVESKMTPKDMENLRLTQRDVATWIDQGALNRVKGQIEFNYKAKKNKDVKSALLDTLAPIERFENDMHQLEHGIKGEYGAEESAYKAGRVVAGAGRAAEQFVEEEIQPVIREIEKAKLNIEDVISYSVAKHAKELENVWKKEVERINQERTAANEKPLNPKEIDQIQRDFFIESGFLESDVDKTLQELDSPVMRSIHKKIVDFNHKLLDYAVKGQLVPPDTAKLLKEKYPDYIPFKRAFDEAVGGSFITSGRGYADLASPIKRIKGSNLNVINPLQSMVQNAFNIFDAVAKNRVGLNLSRFSDIDGAGSAVERLGGDTSVKKENIITVWEKGERVQYQLDPELYRAIKRMDDETSNLITNISGAVSNVLRVGVTNTPDFGLRNLFHDQFDAFFVSNHGLIGYRPFYDMIHGIVQVLGQGKYFKEWVAEGGAHGARVSDGYDLYKQAMRKLKSDSTMARLFKPINLSAWYRLSRRISEVSEEATKVGEYRRLRKRGLSKAESAFESRNLMDFARSGHSVKTANRYVPFLNANIQGKYRLYEAATKHPTRTAFRLAIGAVVPTLGFFGYNELTASPEQKKVIANAPDWLKRSFWLMAGQGDTVYRVPKPFDVNAVVINPLEEYLNFLAGKEHKTVGEILKTSAIDLFSLPYSIALINPIMEIMANKNFFTGSAIIPQDELRNNTPANQVDILKNSLVSQKLGQFFNISPRQIDHLLQGYGGTLAQRYVLPAADFALEKAGLGKRIGGAKLKFSEYPVISAFSVDARGGGKVMDDFYTKLNHYSQLAGDIKDKKIQYNQAIMEISRTLNHASSMIHDKRTQMNNALKSTTLSPADKRTKADKLNQDMQDIARTAIQNIKEKEKQR